MRVVSSLLFGVKYEDYSQRDSISDTSEKLLLGYSLYFAPNKTWLASLTLCLKKKKVNSCTATMKKGPSVDVSPLLQLYKELEPCY